MYTFYDYGLVWDQNPTALDEAAKTRQLASTGGGFRLNLTSTVLANFEMAKPLTRPVAAFNDMGYTKPLRFFFGLICAF